MHSQRLKEYRWIQYASLVLGGLIILSTMFLKQHSVIDVVGAGAMAVICYQLVYVAAFKNSRPYPDKQFRTSRLLVLFLFLIFFLSKFDIHKIGIIFKCCRNWILSLHFLRMDEQHFLCTRFSNSSTRMANPVICHSTWLKICFATPSSFILSGCSPIFLLYSSASSALNSPSIFGSSYNPAKRPFAGRFRIATFSPS